MGKQGEPIGHWLTRTCAYSRTSPTPLDGAHCNALLLAHWSVRQKLNRVSSDQLRRSVRAVSRIRLCTNAAVGRLHWSRHGARSCPCPCPTSCEIQSCIYAHRPHSHAVHLHHQLPPRPEASIPTPGGRSLRPVKHREKGFVESVCKIAYHRKRCFSSKCTTNHLAAELCPDPLAEFTALPQNL